MEIKINRELNDDLSELIKANKYKLELFNKRNYFRCLLLSFLGIILIVAGITGNSHFINYLLTSLGTLAELIVIRFLIFVRSSNKKYIQSKIKSLSGDKTIIVVISDLLFTYREPEKYYELKWGEFDSYKEYKEFLFLIIQHDILSSFALSKDEIPEEEYIELKKFLSNFLPEWK